MYITLKSIKRNLGFKGIEISDIVIALPIITLFIILFCFTPLKIPAIVGLMIGVLKKQKTAEEMSNSLNYFQDILPDEMFKKLFGLLLTDRGSEFAKPQLFEINHETGEIRGNIFYCDAQMPSQKPHVENNHEFIRAIIPKKINIKNLTQDKLNLLFSHINSVPRKSLGGKTPYEAFEFFYGKETLDKLNIQKIEKDKVTLQPYLLKL